MRNVVNRLRYVDVEAHAVKAHTQQGGCEGAVRGNQRGGGRGRGRGRGRVEWDKEDGVDTD